MACTWLSAQSVTGCIGIVITENDFDEPAQIADRTAGPGRSNAGMLISVERRDTAGVEAALAGEIGDNGRQQGIQMVVRGQRHVDDAEAVEQRAGQTGDAVSGGRVTDGRRGRRWSGAWGPGNGGLTRSR